MCYTETPVRVAVGKGAKFSYRLDGKTTVEGVCGLPLHVSPERT